MALLNDEAPWWREVLEVAITPFAYVLCVLALIAALCLSPEARRRWFSRNRHL